MSVEIRRASQRFLEPGPGRATHHSLSFGSAYDPERLTFGPMVCHDDHQLTAGSGFEEHRHSDLVIVTWVVTGALLHSGSATVPAGSLAILRTGPGVTHSEVAAEPQTRFVQVWLRPSAEVLEPSYDVLPLDLLPGSLVEAAGPELLGVAGATFAVARLAPGEVVDLPEAPLVHVYVARGALLRSSLAEPLLAGDAFEIRNGEPGLFVTAAVPTELLVWSFTAVGG